MFRDEKNIIVFKQKSWKLKCNFAANLRIGSVPFCIHSRQIFALFDGQLQATRVQVEDEAKLDLPFDIDSSVSTSVSWINAGQRFRARLQSKKKRAWISAKQLSKAIKVSHDTICCCGRVIKGFSSPITAIFCTAPHSGLFSKYFFHPETFRIKSVAWKTDKKFDNFSVFFNKINNFIAQNVNFVEKHAKIIKVLSVFQATRSSLNVSKWS